MCEDNGDTASGSYHISQSESVQEVVPQENVFRTQLGYVAVCLFRFVALTMFFTTIIIFIGLIRLGKMLPWLESLPQFELSRCPQDVSSSGGNLSA